MPFIVEGTGPSAKLYIVAPGGAYVLVVGNPQLTAQQQPLDDARALVLAARALPVRAETLLHNPDHKPSGAARPTGVPATTPASTPPSRRHQLQTRPRARARLRHHDAWRARPTPSAYNARVLVRRARVTALSAVARAEHRPSHHASGSGSRPGSCADAGADSASPGVAAGSGAASSSASNATSSVTPTRRVTARTLP